MKKLISLLVLALCAFGCSAGSSEELGESREAICTNAPIATGTVGASWTFLHGFEAVPGIPSSLKVFAATSPTGDGVIDFGGTSDAQVFTAATGGCTYGCVPFSGKIFSLLLFREPYSGLWLTSVHVNATAGPGGLPGSHVAEIKGNFWPVGNSVSMTFGTGTPNSGLRRIRQDTGVNGKFYFEGRNDAGAFLSYPVTFQNSCGVLP